MSRGRPGPLRAALDGWAFGCLALGYLALVSLALTNPTFPAAPTPATRPGNTVPVPSGFPVPAIPADNAFTAEKAELGRYLFYDRRLSATGTFSCASCHRQALAFSDGKPRAIGATGEVHRRNAMSLANVVYNRTFN